MLIVDAESLALRNLALRHGLTRLDERPPLPRYLAELWARRGFVAAFARARLTAKYSGARLGSLWQVVTPLLNAGVYFLVFGVLLRARHGIPDYVPFLVTGVFVWTYTSASVSAGVKAISGNQSLVRALHFPRAALPVAVCLQQAQVLGFSLLVLAGVVLGFGVPPSPHWLLMVPALVLQTMFNLGLAAAAARAGSRLPDLAQTLPFVLRTWMYFSGVMYSLPEKAAGAPEVVRVLLRLNPAALYIDLTRDALLDSVDLPLSSWLAAAAWALLIGVGGVVWFWAGEQGYGRG
jgi:teichoic acid transport system permease protein